jgi:preprotein translocase subunit SecA
MYYGEGPRSGPDVVDYEIKLLSFYQNEVESCEIRQKNVEQDIIDAKKVIKELSEKLASKQMATYNAREDLLHINEILRLAKIHFPRLRKQSDEKLTEADYRELEKWINRAKSPDSLKVIVLALNELSKYYPEDIKSNLYALVQKIIIGGAFGGKKK